MNVPQVYKMPRGYRGDTYLSPEFRKVNEIDDPLTIGMLEIGEEYLIKDYKVGDDFTDVGASENKTGIIFTATGTTPAIWTEATSIVKIENIDLTGASIVMSVYRKNILIYTFTTVDTSVVIVDALKGIFKLADTVLTFYGDVTYDIQVTLASGIVKTYLKGSWTILNDIPQNC